MAQLVQFGPWRIDCDIDGTREAYASVTAGSPDRCGCRSCRNWRLTSGKLYPGRLSELLGSLGINPVKEAEVYADGPLESGLHRYAGWWHAVGRIAEDAGGTWSPPGVPGIELVVVDANHAAFGAFEGLMTVQVEFHAEIPWLLDVPPNR